MSRPPPVAFVALRTGGEAYLQARFPGIFAHCLARGLDISRVPLPVVPAAHYFIGGVAVDLQGRTSIPGLLAAGEVQSHLSSFQPYHRHRRDFAKHKNNPGSNNSASFPSAKHCIRSWHRMHASFSAPMAKGAPSSDLAGPISFRWAVGIVTWHTFCTSFI
jgi:hypothetical protein